MMEVLSTITGPGIGHNKQLLNFKHTISSNASHLSSWRSFILMQSIIQQNLHLSIVSLSIYPSFEKNPPGHPNSLLFSTNYYLTYDTSVIYLYDCKCIFILSIALIYRFLLLIYVDSLNWTKFATEQAMYDLQLFLVSFCS